MYVLYVSYFEKNYKGGDILMTTISLVLLVFCKKRIYNEINFNTYDIWFLRN